MPRNPVLRALSSLSLTLFCLALLIVLVVLCTLAQVPMGIHGAVEAYIRSFLVWWGPEGAGWKIPVFPGGGLVGAVLLVNLLFAQFLRLERSWRKGGLWLTHAGLAFLFLGEFGAAFWQVDSRLAFEEGQTKSWTEDYRRVELVAVDATDPAFDDERRVPESLLKTGATLKHESLPFTLKVKAYHRNAELTMRREGDPASPATAGLGTRIAVRPLPPVTADDQEDTHAALVEPVAADGTSYGTFLVSDALEGPQAFVHGGRTWRLALRRKRYDLPFSLTLKDFKHDKYPGTEIPKNFSSLVRLKDAARGDDRDILIYMNSPLRHAGLTFYQASFGKNDTLSVLSVVRNPSWTVPYLACLMVAAGLLWHFGISLRNSLRRAA